ncbi:hypothetical protein [Carbonactinospora thermoautotrophica]|uniref:hypothetical protein n=1 Tax=Carbonactinospora thermoautotrophica TaxID=1469144 RepID=UPI00355875BE
MLAAVLASAVFPAAKWITGFVGAGLTFAALTNTCAMGMLLAKLPYNRGPRADLGSIVAALADGRRWATCSRSPSPPPCSSGWRSVCSAAGRS